MKRNRKLKSVNLTRDYDRFDFGYEKQMRIEKRNKRRRDKEFFDRD